MVSNVVKLTKVGRLCTCAFTQIPYLLNASTTCINHSRINAQRKEVWSTFHIIGLKLKIQYLACIAVPQVYPAMPNHGGWGVVSLPNQVWACKFGFWRNYKHKRTPNSLLGQELPLKGYFFI